MAETLKTKGSTTHIFPNKEIFKKALHQGLLKEGDTAWVEGVEQFDTVPTKDSENLVNSGAVFNAVNERFSKSNIAKNSDIDKLFK